MQRYQPPHLRRGHDGARGSSSPTQEASCNPQAATSTNGQIGHRYIARDASPNHAHIDRAGPSSKSGFSSSSLLPTSRRDWTKSPQSAKVLQSPATDLKPMRERVKAMQVDEMEFMQSVSRSGGDGAEGDALKDFGTQERFRKYVDVRIDKHYNAFTTPRNTAPPAITVEELESLSSIVLLFRKLREGVIASHRIDRFAVEVFEASARYAILAKNTAQLLSSLSGLVPGLYRAVDEALGAGSDRKSAKPGDFDALADHVASLDIGSSGSNPSTNPDMRIEFSSILLLFHLSHTDSFQIFKSTLLSLTSVYGKPLFPKYPVNPPERQSTSNSIQTPFTSTSDLSFAIRASQALSPHRFSPLAFFALLAEPTATPYERIVLGWAESRVKERAWEVMRKAYLGVGTEWAARWLAMKDSEVESWVKERGGRMEAKVIKTR